MYAIVKVDTVNDRCLVKFGDNTQRWSSLKDLAKLSSQDEHELLCVVCKKSNQKSYDSILVCDHCGRGYHQNCHRPNVGIVDAESPWSCSRCTENGRRPHRNHSVEAFGPQTGALRKEVGTLTGGVTDANSSVVKKPVIGLSYDLLVVLSLYNQTPRVFNPAFVQLNPRGSMVTLKLPASRRRDPPGMVMRGRSKKKLYMSSVTFCTVLELWGPHMLTMQVESLTWDSQHRINTEQKYCYCGCTGEWFWRMLQCGRCRQWFHDRCLNCLKYPLYCGDRFYIFVCAVCNGGNEFIRRLELQLVDVVHLALFNLTVINAKKYYDFETVLIPYINENWKYFQLPPK
ncbi:hypothetical protein J437_LFUL007757, partial [Ladona fulva]